MNPHYAYEPKWDGFRCIVQRTPEELRLWSRAGKDLGRYFPEVLGAAGAVPVGVYDGELIVRRGSRLDWDALTARIHPAASRINSLAATTPAEFVAFDLLAGADRELLGEPFSARRQALEAVDLRAPFHRTRYTTDPAVAKEWFVTFEGAGLDGIIAKSLTAPYTPGKRTIIKVKHRRTAEAVLVGYRVHASGSGVGSLLLGMYDENGELVNVGGITALTAAKREEFARYLDPLVLRDEEGKVMSAERERTRFSSAKDTSYLPLRPELVVEVAFDQLEGGRFRHAVTFLRWRPDRDPRDCLVEQVERAPSYDLDQVLR